MTNQDIKNLQSDAFSRSSLSLKRWMDRRQLGTTQPRRDLTSPLFLPFLAELGVGCTHRRSWL